MVLFRQSRQRWRRPNEQVLRSPPLALHAFYSGMACSTQAGAVVFIHSQVGVLGKRLDMVDVLGRALPVQVQPERVAAQGMPRFKPPPELLPYWGGAEAACGIGFAAQAISLGPVCRFARRAVPAFAASTASWRAAGGEDG